MPSADLTKAKKKTKKIKSSTAGSPSKETCTKKQILSSPKKKEDSVATLVARVLEEIESDNSSPGAEGTKVITFINFSFLSQLSN